MATKTKDASLNAARAALKADRARDGMRAMQEYTERRAHAVANMERLRKLRLAMESAPAPDVATKKAATKKADAKV